MKPIAIFDGSGKPGELNPRLSMVEKACYYTCWEGKKFEDFDKVFPDGSYIKKDGIVRNIAYPDDGVIIHKEVLDLEKFSRHGVDPHSCLTEVPNSDHRIPKSWRH